MTQNAYRDMPDRVFIAHLLSTAEKRRGADAQMLAEAAHRLQKAITAMNPAFTVDGPKEHATSEP